MPKYKQDYSRLSDLKQNPSVNVQSHLNHPIWPRIHKGSTVATTLPLIVKVVLSNLRVVNKKNKDGEGGTPHKQLKLFPEIATIIQACFWGCFLLITGKQETEVYTKEKGFLLTEEDLLPINKIEFESLKVNNKQIIINLK